jgi:hypothetical protein
MNTEHRTLAQRVECSEFSVQGSNDPNDRNGPI